MEADAYNNKCTDTYNNKCTDTYNNRCADAYNNKCNNTRDDKSSDKYDDTCDTEYPDTEYRMLEADEISRELFRNFERHQVVEDCWRRENGEWVIRKDPFTDQWSEEDYAFLVTCLQRTVRTGGVLFAAFADRQLKGFVSVEPELFGKNREYMDLSSLHVSEELRGRGIGRKLLYLAADWAKKQGAGKLYLSTHSAVETQAFYRAMGCREAMEYHRGHVEAEPYDIQMELELSAVVNIN